MKGRYNCRSMSSPQYKSGVNKDIHVDIITYLLHLIYILCVFLLIILLINFVSFFETFTRECIIPVNFFNSYFGGISISHIFGILTCI